MVKIASGVKPWSITHVVRCLLTLDWERAKVRYDAEIIRVSIIAMDLDVLFADSTIFFHERPFDAKPKTSTMKVPRAADSTGVAFPVYSEPSSTTMVMTIGAMPLMACHVLSDSASVSTMLYSPFFFRYTPLKNMYTMNMSVSTIPGMAEAAKSFTTDWSVREP